MITGQQYPWPAVSAHGVDCTPKRIVRNGVIIKYISSDQYSIDFSLDSQIRNHGHGIQALDTKSSPRVPRDIGELFTDLPISCV
jgi:hypothetical protein